MSDYFVVRQGNIPQAGAEPSSMANPLAIEISAEQEVELYRLCARYNGSMAKAARELGYNPDTARRWRRRNQELYNKVAKQELETIRIDTAEKHLRLADQATDLESEVIEHVKSRLNDPEKLAKTETRDLTTISRNLATETGIHTDKAVDLLGLKDRNVTAVQVNLDLGGMVQAMAAKGTKFYDAEGNEVDPAAIDSTATEKEE